MERIERGWAGHFCCGPDCYWRRNTLVKDENGRGIVISSVGALPKSDRKGWLEIGLNRYYETMVFIAKQGEVFTEANVSKQINIAFLPWYVSQKPNGKTDLEAEEIHEKNVKYVMEHFDECYKDGEKYGRGR